MNAYFDLIINFFADHPVLALAIIFLVAMAEALFILGLFVPSTVVLVNAGVLVGMGKLDFRLVIIATTLGAIAGDAISYWVGRFWKEDIKTIWPFRRYRRLIEHGETFFDRHGGKSIFIGRFIPGIKSVVPAIAGLAGMDNLRFTIVNAVSAFVWALVHIMPGVGIGRGLDVAQESNPRLMILLLLLTLIALSCWYGTKLILRVLMPHFWRFRRHLAARLAISKTWLGLKAGRFLMDRGGQMSRRTYLFLAYLFALLFSVLSLLLIYRPPVQQFDMALQTYLMELRTETFEPLMLWAHTLGHPWVLIAVFAPFLLILMIFGHHRLAATISFLVGLVAFLAIAIKGIGTRERPFPLESYHLLDYAFPSLSTTLTMLVYGGIMIVLFWRFKFLFRGYIIGGLCTAVGLVGFSQVYLGQHWPSDVLASGFMAGSALALFCHTINRYLLIESDFSLKQKMTTVATVSASACTLMVLASPDIFRSHSLENERPSQVFKMTSEQWQNGGWRKIDQARALFDGEVAEPLLLQANLAPETLQRLMRQVGWHRHKAKARDSLVDAIIPRTAPLKKQTVMPSTHKGQIPDLIFTKQSDKRKRAVLRFWDSQYLVDDQPLYLASVNREHLKSLLFDLSYIERTTISEVQQDRIFQSVVAPISERNLASIDRAIGEHNSKSITFYLMW